MSLYRFSLQVVSRRSGRSAVAAAAYRAGERLHFEREGVTFDYRGREQDVAYRELFRAHGRTREELWNGAEWAERRWDSVVAREIVVALPHELTHALRVDLVRDFAWTLSVQYRVAVDVALHLPSRHPRADQRNYHAHLLFTTREVSKEAFGKKTRILDSPKTGPAEVRWMRKAWRGSMNFALVRAKLLSLRVDERSYAEQGLIRIPGRHLGPKASLIERQGGITAVGEHNRAVALANRVREWLGGDFGRMPRTALEIRRDFEAMRDRAWKLVVEGGEGAKERAWSAQQLANELLGVLRPMERETQLEKSRSRGRADDRGLSL